MKHILITRPKDQADEIARVAESLGFSPLMAPMLEIAALAPLLPDLSLYQALVFTSVNGVRMFAGMTGDRSHPVYTVGGQTKKAALEAGWENVFSADGTAADMISYLGRRVEDHGTPLLHVCGADVAVPIDAPGLSIDPLPVYKAVPVQNFTDELLLALDENTIVAALFYSARTAQAFVHLLEKYERTEAISSIKALCLSDSVVKSVEGLPWEGVRVAGRPDGEAMRALLGEV
ncbi:MAG: uroporphyrinogen-III synthase [Rhodospirillales bacterium]|nr:uroporphyrinogen-III synthase [Rhodospirillales bacterium]